MSSENTRAAVEEAATTLTQKIISAVDDGNPAAAVQYAEALDSTCRGLASVAEAQRDDRADDE